MTAVGGRVPHRASEAVKASASQSARRRAMEWASKKEEGKIRKEERGRAFGEESCRATAMVAIGAEAGGAPALQLAAENFHYLLDRVPISVCRRDTEVFLDLSEIADGFHLTTVDAEDESTLDRDNLYQPIGRRGQRK